METSWSSGGLSGKEGDGGKMVNQVDIWETNPQIKKHSTGKETSDTSRNSNNGYVVWIWFGVGLLILIVVLGLLWWWKNEKKTN